MKHFILSVFFLGLLTRALGQAVAPNPVYRDDFPTLESALGFIKYALEKPQSPPAVTSGQRVTTITVDSNTVRFGPLEEEEVRIFYRFHALTEVANLDPSPADSVAVTAVDIELESQFMLLDLLVYSPLTEKETRGLVGMQLTLDEERPQLGSVGSYVVTRDGRRTARDRTPIEKQSEKVLLLCYDEMDRGRIANAFYQAQHLARTRNRLRKLAKSRR